MTARLTARPTTYKGVEMRSRTEARYAAFLDIRRQPWEYEPRCFASEDGQYLPDFKVTDRAAVVYVEVKGAMPEDIEDLQRRMEIIWASEPTASLMIVVVSPGESFTAHPDTGEWSYHRPRRSLLEPEASTPDAPSRPTPTAEDLVNLAALRKARTVLAHTIGDHETCGPDCVPVAATHAAGDHAFCAPDCQDAPTAETAEPATEPATEPEGAEV